MARIEIKSEITGTVWKLKSRPGDKVESGDTLVVIESMKMEIPVITEDPGTVLEIRVKEKDPVAEGRSSPSWTADASKSVIGDE